MPVSKLRSGTSKTKAGQGGLLRVALFWKSHCATCSPACVILYHVTGSCKVPIVQANSYTKELANWHQTNFFRGVEVNFLILKLAIANKNIFKFWVCTFDDFSIIKGSTKHSSHVPVGTLNYSFFENGNYLFIIAIWHFILVRQGEMNRCI